MRGKLLDKINFILYPDALYKQLEYYLFILKEY